MEQKIKILDPFPKSRLNFQESIFRPLQLSVQKSTTQNEEGEKLKF